MIKPRNNILSILSVCLIVALLASTLFFYVSSQDMDCQITIGRFHKTGEGNVSMDVSRSGPLSGGDTATVLNALLSAKETQAPYLVSGDPAAVLFIHFPPKPELGTKFIYVWITDEAVCLSSDPDARNASFRTVPNTNETFRDLLIRALDSYT